MTYLSSRGERLSPATAVGRGDGEGGQGIIMQRHFCAIRAKPTRNKVELNG